MRRRLPLKRRTDTTGRLQNVSSSAAGGSAVSTQEIYDAQKDTGEGSGVGGGSDTEQEGDAKASQDASDDQPVICDAAILKIKTDCNLICSAPQTLKHPAYADLAHDGIRLLKILPGDKNSTVRCHMQEFLLHDILDYTALSYTWGSQHGIHEILVNGHPLLIPKNLWRFLNQARDLRGDLSGWFWVDMLSINQVDLAERGHQVNLMARIFKTASRVVVWLGPAYRGSNHAMVALSRLSNAQITKQTARLWMSDAGHAMSGLCRRPYWRRLWIFQELRLAREIRLMCGSKMATWHEFETLMQSADIRSGLSHLYDNMEVVLDTPAMRMTRLNLRSVDTGLWNLIRETSHLRCYDVRDKIYALLGVATKGHTNIEPDYSTPIPTLLNKLVHGIWKLSPPETLEEAAKCCDEVEKAMGVDRGTILVMKTQRGTYNAPSEKEMQVSRLGPKLLAITLWWTVFYGHSNVQVLLQRAWNITFFEAVVPAPISEKQSTAAVGALFCTLRQSMDRRTSFLSPPRPRPMLSPNVERGNASMEWIPLYLTEAIRRYDQHTMRLVADIALSCGLVFPHLDMYDFARTLAGVFNHYRFLGCYEWNEHDRALLTTSLACIEPVVVDKNELARSILCSAFGSQGFARLLCFCLKYLVHLSRKSTVLARLLGPAIEFGYGAAINELWRLLSVRERDLGIMDPQNGMTLLMCAACYGMEVEFEALVDTGNRDVNRANTFNGMSPLHYAAQNGHDAVVKHILGVDGCNINGSDKLGRTALMMAAEEGHLSVARLLLECPTCDVNIVDDCGKTALMSAVSSVDLIKILLETRSCDANQADLHGWTTLMHAACRAQCGSVQCPREDGCTTEGPVSYSWMNDSDEHKHRAEVLTLLLNHRDRHDINARDNAGQTLLLLAVRYAGCTSYFREHGVITWTWTESVQSISGIDGCDVNLRSDDGDTALSLAVKLGDIDTTQMLIKRANTDEPGRAGMSLLAIARQNGYTEIEKILIQDRKARENWDDLASRETLP